MADFFQIEEKLFYCSNYLNSNSERNEIRFTERIKVRASGTKFYEEIIGKKEKKYLF